MSSEGIFVGDCKMLGGKASRWPRVDGKPHTAMTFAGTIVGRQPSWGCFGGGAPGPGRSGLGDGQASSGASMTRFALASPGFR